MPLPDNISIFPGITTNDHDPNVLLGAAERASLTQVVIIGYEPDGEMFFSSSIANGPDVLWLLELAKRRLLDIGAGEDA